jgi:hypothetical protein
MKTIGKIRIVSELKLSNITTHNINLGLKEIEIEEALEMTLLPKSNGKASEKPMHFKKRKKF